MNTITTNTILDQYAVICYGKEVSKRVNPVLEKILQYQGTDEELTVRKLGEALMGEEYNKLIEHRWADGDVWRERTDAARSMTATITAALWKMEKLGLVKSYTRKDMDHPHTFEQEDYVWFLGDVELPNEMSVKLANGANAKIPAWNIVGAEMREVKRTVTKYPKIKCYKFNV